MSGLSWKKLSVGVAVAVAIGVAAPAFGQTSAAVTNSGANAPQPTAQTPPGTQPAAPQATLPPQSSPGASTPPAAAPAGSATAGPPATAPDARAASETPPTIASGVRRTSDGRLAFFSGAQAASVDLPGGGKRSVKSLLKIAKSLSYGEYVWDEQGVPKGRIWVLVDPEHQLISVFRGKHEIGTAVTLYGAPEFPTPAGQFRILARMKDHVSRKYDNAPMPYTLRLTNDGVSIHGNNVLEGYASHGCVGVPLDFARRLFAEARIGDEVFVLRDKQAKTAQK